MTSHALDFVDPAATMFKHGVFGNPLSAVPGGAMAVSTVIDIDGVIDFPQEKAELSRAASVGRAIHADPIR